MTKPALPEREIVEEELEVESYESRFVAFSPERAYEPATGAVGPFDLERDARPARHSDREHRADLARGEAANRAADGAREIVGEPTEPMDTIPGADVPFDFERETSGARAA